MNTLLRYSVEAKPQRRYSRSFSKESHRARSGHFLMLAGAVWGWKQGYAAFDTTTAVWLIVMAVVLAMIISPWPHRHTYW